jgi:hypothetical protein
MHDKQKFNMQRTSITAIIACYQKKLTKGLMQTACCVIMNPSNIAGWSSLVARWAHNPKVVGSNPTPATIEIKGLTQQRGSFFHGKRPRCATFCATFCRNTCKTCALRSRKSPLKTGQRSSPYMGYELHTIRDAKRSIYIEPAANHTVTTYKECGHGQPKNKSQETREGILPSLL